MTGKVIVSALVGGVLLFLWQSLSWTVLDLHGNAINTAAEGQVEILDRMVKHLDQNMYYLSHADPDADMAMQNAQMEGKPVAIVNFIPNHEYAMAPLMIRGLIHAILVAGVISLILSRSRAKAFMSRWLIVMGFALVLILFDTLGDMNWWYHPMNWVWPEAIDYLAMFGLSGLWMAWWMGRGQPSY
jgi:hypothetical protein